MIIRMFENIRRYIESEIEKEKISVSLKAMLNNKEKVYNVKITKKQADILELCLIYGIKNKSELYMLIKQGKKQ